ncbi:hypothetical protein [Novosphingobium mangrovi (ex Huang et al. 2023)]|uniref:Acyl-protein synthetase LuxE domain-containing protein n=1 Tax=Novosphingobium mangrovi (ex Huang et al. 2023) TaxID=2976432 RepID=A0ABT2I8Q2_9SPHN|nr:hypothetical protein [Novosphingobium mangrovi (ex Huang et al. 2023)]MCT2401206.1 hypothetical protein [Novosphingobium mangrovi (ex Huang et al. 2023)]
MLDPLRLEAAQELFAERIEQIPLLKKRAQEAGIDRIETFSDLVPLLFAHTVYKSYPKSLFDKGRWTQLLKWMQSLAVSDLSNVDVEGVADVDEFVERLWQAGHAVLTTSGSSGKVSFLVHTMGDRALKTRHIKHTQAWPFLEPGPGRTIFWFGPMRGRNSAVELAITNEQNWGAEGETRALDERPLLISEVSKSAAMQQRLAEGVATPDEIAEFEAEQKAKGRASRQELAALIDELLDRRHEPLLIYSGWAQQLMVRDRARERGIEPGDFHPDTVLMAAGGVKGLALPDDYRDQVYAFYGPKIAKLGVYGMTEMAQLMPRCEAGRYHVPPGLILLLLDQAGERLLGKEDEVDGKLTGRVGFLDLLYEGRWGGLITGDQATLDMSDQCACGRSGPSLLDTVARYTQLGVDDHIGCAGTIDAYVRAGLSE